MRTMTSTAHPPSARSPFGDHLRHWRQHRRLSQQGLALEAEISTRHLSYVETGRAQPSREMVLRLVERLGVPLRERNALLVAAGYAPMYQARPLDKVRRLSLHPEGLGPSLANAAHWRAHLLHRLQQQIAATSDAQLQALHDEIAAYPFKEDEADSHGAAPASHIAVPFALDTDHGRLNFISTITIFGTPVDVTLQELAVESFFPADTATQVLLSQLRSGTAKHP